MHSHANIASSDPYVCRARERFFASLGPAALKALYDREVDELMLNCDGRLFIEHKIEGLMEIGHLDAADAEAFVRTLATLKGAELKALTPIFSGEIPDLGARVEALLPPLVRAPVFSIRKHNARALSLDDLCRGGVMKKPVCEFLKAAVRGRRTIVVSGSTGSGKTTLVNAFLNELSLSCPQDRILTLEDTPELEVRSPDRLQLFTSLEADLSVLLRSALRLRPDRIVVGEVRGAEALDLMDAFSTGHQGGMCTVHAGSIEQALSRLVLLISRHPKAPRLIEPTLGLALDLMVQVVREPKRHIAAIAAVRGFEKGHFVVEQLSSQGVMKLKKT